MGASTTPKSAPTPALGGGVGDDDWNFSSALPEESPPSSASIKVWEKAIQIVFEVSRRQTEEAVIDVVAHFSNQTAAPITEYTFQVAVTKVCLFWDSK